MARHADPELAIRDAEYLHGRLLFARAAPGQRADLLTFLVQEENDQQSAEAVAHRADHGLLVLRHAELPAQRLRNHAGEEGADELILQRLLLRTAFRKREHHQCHRGISHGLGAEDQHGLRDRADAASILTIGRGVHDLQERGGERDISQNDLCELLGAVRLGVDDAIDVADRGGQRRKSGSIGQTAKHALQRVFTRVVGRLGGARHRGIKSGCAGRTPA